VPAELDRIRRAIQRKNPSMPESKAWAIATDAFKKKHGIRGKTTEEEMARASAEEYVHDKLGSWIDSKAKELVKTADLSWVDKYVAPFLGVDAKPGDFAKTFGIASGMPKKMIQPATKAKPLSSYVPIKQYSKFAVRPSEF
jgi:hypothetical protein